MVRVYVSLDSNAEFFFFYDTRGTSTTRRSGQDIILDRLSFHPCSSLPPPTPTPSFFSRLPSLLGLRCRAGSSWPPARVMQMRNWVCVCVREKERVCTHHTYISYIQILRPELRLSSSFVSPSVKNDNNSLHYSAFILLLSGTGTQERDEIALYAVSFSSLEHVTDKSCASYDGFGGVFDNKQPRTCEISSIS